jgi:hypothetical protein
MSRVGRTPLVLSILLFSQLSLASDEDLHASFEEGKIDEIWRSDKFEAGAVQVQSEVAKAPGKYAARITVRTGQIQGTGQGGVATERAELQLRKELWTHEGEAYRYSFSLYLPTGFPKETQRTVLGQWRQICPTQDSCKVDNPILAQRMKKGKFSISLYGDSGEPKVLYETKKLPLGRWLDFAYEVKFSKQDDGFVRVRLDGKELVDFKGVTAYSSQVGYAGVGEFDFRVGLYRDRMKRPATVYVDEFRRQKL